MAILVKGELYEGITRQLFEIGRQIQQPNGYPFDPDKLRRHLQDAIEGRFAHVMANVYRLFVDYGQTAKDAIKPGLYDWHNDDISDKNFPTKRSGNVELDVELVHFGKDMSTDEVLAELDKRGFRAAELHELLALGAKFPDLQREFPIIALGSVWQDSFGDRDCPYLSRGDSRRKLVLHWLGHGWRGYCRFAAVRK